jgi:hypothetical protein
MKLSVTQQFVNPDQIQKIMGATVTRVEALEAMRNNTGGLLNLNIFRGGSNSSAQGSSVAPSASDGDGGIFSVLTKTKGIIGFK